MTSAPPQREDIVRHRMVSWFAPSTLARAVLETGISTLFGRFADKRELQAGMPAEPYVYAEDDVGDDGCFWVDFASDVGDGFDSTYTIAWLLAQPRLSVDWNGQGHDTARGRILVLGGDEVYPAASWERYAERFSGPYRAALPFVAQRAPHLFAIPGNHDWYDGLTSFMRVFCQRRWIGGWRTRQRRSYFAIRLPRRWWLWGIDIQLDTYIDEAQLAYFDRVALQPGDRVVLVTSKPSWVHAGRRPVPQSWRTLTYFEERHIKDRGVALALAMTGDIHHYCHYEGAGEPGHRITSGGGGAYLSGTHPMPDPLTVEPHGSSAPVTYERVATYPSIEDSRRMSRGVLRLLSPALTPTLGVLTGAIYAAFALLLAAGVKDQQPDLLPAVGDRYGLGLLGDAVNPWWILLAALLWLGLHARAEVEAEGGLARIAKRSGYGTGHWLAHLAPMTAFALLVLWGLHELGMRGDGFWPGYLTAAVVFAFGLVWGRWVLATYFYLANRGHPLQHPNDVFASQSIEDYKQFLRLRVDRHGELTVFPIGVREAVRDWTFKGPGHGDELLEPWYEPASGRPPSPELIEKPFRV